MASLAPTSSAARRASARLTAGYAPREIICSFPSTRFRRYQTLLPAGDTSKESPPPSAYFLRPFLGRGRLRILASVSMYSLHVGIVGIAWRSSVGIYALLRCRYPCVYPQKGWIAKKLPGPYRNKKKARNSLIYNDLRAKMEVVRTLGKNFVAEGEGFEPPDASRHQRFSRPPH